MFLAQLKIFFKLDITERAVTNIKLFDRFYKHFFSAMLQSGLFIIYMKLWPEQKHVGSKFAVEVDLADKESLLDRASIRLRATKSLDCFMF